MTFSNDFNSISMYNYSPGSFSGPSGNIKHTGTRTTLLKTDDPHPYLDQLEGTYNLNVTYRNYLAGIDTQYVQNTAVTMASNTVNIDSEYYHFQNFHSYCISSSNVSQQNLPFRYLRSIEWSDNTLSMDCLEIQGGGMGLTDTVHYTYNGTK